MQISSSRLARYRADVDELADRARAVLAALYDWMGLATDVAEARDELIEAIRDILGIYGEAAQEVAMQLFEEVCEAEGIDARAAMLEGAIDPGRVERKVRYHAAKLAAGDWEGFRDASLDVIRYYVKRSAYEQMAHDCDQNDVRYARVPSGRETCGFCFMLASRGFVYRSEDLAYGAHGMHEGCDCVIVSGARGRTRIAGYDEKGMRKRLGSCVEALGGDAALRERWDTLSDEERARYLKDDRTEAEAFNRWKLGQIVSEVETRDWRWLYTGILPDTDYTQAARQSYGRFVREPDMTKAPNPDDYSRENFVNPKDSGEWRDLFAHDVLRWNGYKIAARTNKFRGEDGKLIQGATSPDLEFDKDAWGSGYLWEIKSPRPGEVSPRPGNELAFIRRVFKDAHEHNFKNPYDSTTKEPVSDSDGKTRVILNLLYRPIDADDQTLYSEIRRRMESEHVHEVIVIDAHGNIVHIS